MSKPYQAAVVIGRFQIPHRGHEAIFTKAAEIADQVIVLIGSVGQPKTPKNPFSFDERKEMLVPIISTITSKHNATYSLLPIRDQRYNLQHWIVDAVNKVRTKLATSGWADKPPKVAIVGHYKDESSFYLNEFPMWDQVFVENVESINSTDIRNLVIRSGLCLDHPDLRPSTVEFLNKWLDSEEYTRIEEEHQFLSEYHKSWEAAPYKPTFVTVDAVVIQSGHILMIERGFAPGKGLLALPGGFLDEGETLRQAVVRELVEETKIKLQPIIIDRNITRTRVYDSPSRSERGRTITHAFLIELSGHELPRIKGSSDAKKAKWIPLNEVFMMGEQIYEDHLDIIMNITGDR